MQDEPSSPIVKSDRPSRGRPRDPALEERVFDAAVAIYAGGGWAALVFDAVARRAGVGKAALYRRWPTREALFVEMLEARWHAVGTIDTGTLAGDLLAIAKMSFAALTGPYGGVLAYLRADAHRFPDFHEISGPYGRQAVRQSRAIIQRAIERGELAPSADASLILDIIFGAVTSHVGSTPAPLRATMIARGDVFTRDLVDFVMAGIAARTA